MDQWNQVYPSAPSGSSPTIAGNFNGLRTSLYSTKFVGSSLPGGWSVFSGNAWGVNNGLSTPPSGAGYASSIYLSRYYNLNNRTQRIAFRITTAGAIVGVGNLQDSNAVNSLAWASLFWLDSAANTLNIGNAWNGSTNPGVAQSVPLGFSLVVGLTYTLFVTRDHRVNKLEITDSVSGTYATVSAGNNSTDDGSIPITGAQMDFITFVNIAGQFTIISVDVFANISNTRMLFGPGDSITEGYTLPEGEAWPSLVGSQLANFIISGRPGSYSSTTLARLTSEVIPLNPNIVATLSGTNDAGQGIPLSTYEQNMTSYFAGVRLMGAKLIICTIPPVGGQASVQTTINQMNAFLLAQPADGHVRFDVALATNQLDVLMGNAAPIADLSKLNPNDKVHPNQAGGVAMAARFRIDVPWVFD